MGGDPTPLVREEAVQFGATGCLVGVVTEPAVVRAELPAFVLLSAGITHRVGPNRLFVRIARELAALGFVALRYDASITGDSKLASPRAGAANLEALHAEPRHALDWLAVSRGIERFVMLGICSGAVASFSMVRRDPRVVGAVLIGLPPPRGPLTTRVMARHFLRLTFASSFRARKWRALVALRFDFRRVVRTIASLVGSTIRRPLRRAPLVPRAASEALVGVQGELVDVRRHVAALVERGVRLTFIHAEGDEGLDYSRMLLGRDLGKLPASDRLTMTIIPGANHVYTLRSSQTRLLAVVRTWAASFIHSPSDR